MRSTFRISVLSGLLTFTLAWSSGCKSTTEPTPLPSNSVRVSIPAGAATLTTTAFDPDVAEVAAGTTVVWTNTDSETHTTTANAGAWHSTLSPGKSYSVMFPTAGTYSYHCAIHPGMVGTVVVH